MNLGNCVPLCLIAFVGCFVLSQVPSISSGLAGGVQVTTMGALGAVGREMSRINVHLNARQRVTQIKNLGQKLANFRRKNTIGGRK